MTESERLLKKYENEEFETSPWSVKGDGVAFTHSKLILKSRTAQRQIEQFRKIFIEKEDEKGSNNTKTQKLCTEIFSDDE